MTAIALYNKPSPDFASKLALTRNLLRQVAEDHGSDGGDPVVVQANSLGAEDMVVAHLIQALGLPVPMFVLETGALHPETLALLARVQVAELAAGRAPVRVFRPVPEAVVQFVTREGNDAMYRSMALRKACCGIRKMEPLGRALAGQRAWVTGLRKEQSDARSEVALVDRTDPQLIKYNPLAQWTWGDVWHYIATHHVDHNPLHDQFHPSIGCAPCTRAIALGEDFRAGRWWWENEAAKECGLHASTAQNTPLEVESV